MMRGGYTAFCHCIELPESFLAPSERWVLNNRLVSVYFIGMGWRQDIAGQDASVLESIAMTDVGPSSVNSSSEAVSRRTNPVTTPHTTSASLSSIHPSVHFPVSSPFSCNSKRQKDVHVTLIRQQTHTSMTMPHFYAIMSMNHPEGHSQHHLGKNHKIINLRCISNAGLLD